MIEAIPIFIALSLCYGFVGVVLMALYIDYQAQYRTLLSFVFSSWYYRIFFFVLCVCSFFVLVWQDIGASYVILMFLLLLGLIDIKCLALPDMLNFSLLLVCVVYAFLESSIVYESFMQRVLLGFGVGGVFFTLKILYQSFMHKDIIGEADIVVLSALGIAFGALSAFVSVFLGSIVALVYALFLAIWYKRNLIHLKLPFCFFIFVGTIMQMLWLSYGDLLYA